MEEPRSFIENWKQRVRVRVGMEATGYSLWFERLLAFSLEQANGRSFRAARHSPKGHMVSGWLCTREPSRSRF